MFSFYSEVWAAAMKALTLLKGEANVLEARQREHRCLYYPGFHIREIIFLLSFSLSDKAA